MLLASGSIEICNNNEVVILPPIVFYTSQCDRRGIFREAARKIVCQCLW